MVTPSFTLTPEEVAQARRLYDEHEALENICARLNVSPRWFQRFRQANGWPPRSRMTSPRPRRPASERLIQSLDATVERECLRVQKALQDGAVAVDARMLANLVKALGELRRIKREDRAENKHDAADARDDPPRELAELRAELARRLERLRRERAAE